MGSDPRPVADRHDAMAITDSANIAVTHCCVLPLRLRYKSQVIVGYIVGR